MEEKSTITVLKSTATKNIEVLYAASLENQIRFYLNDTDYIATIEEDDKNTKTVLGKADQSEYENDKAKKKELIKKYPWKFIGLILLTILLMLPAVTTILMLAILLKGNIFAYIIALNAFVFLYNVGEIFIMEYATTSRVLKRKHAAEHMIINFMETNNRLPRNVEEVSKYSRISKACGSRKLMKNCATDFVQNIAVCIFSIIVSLITLWITKSAGVEMLVFIFTYVVPMLFLKIKKPKVKCLEFFSKPIDKVLFRFIQYANTTKKYVTTGDIVLAYKSAKPWVQTVYPEYYSEEDEIFASLYFGL